MARKKWWYAGGAALLLITVALFMEWRSLQRPHARTAPARPEAWSPIVPDAIAGRLLSGTTKSPAPKPASVTSGYELCGLGRAPAQITPDALNEYVFTLTQKTGDLWSSALLDSSDLRARAMGLLLRHAEARFQSPGTTDELAQKLPEQVREELVQLAAGGTDPVVYAAATWICESGTSRASQTGACRRISLSGWARVDPDNAMPWLEVAMEDRSRGDLQAEAADFARAAAAHKSDFYQDSLLRAAFAEMPHDAMPLAEVAVAFKYVGILSAQPLLELSEASRFCSIEALHQSDRHESCDALARLWVSHGSSLLELGMGKALGRRLGWSVERLSQLDQEFESIRSLAREDASEPWSCQSVASNRRLLEGRAQQGELNFMRGMLERSPPPAGASESRATPDTP